MMSDTSNDAIMPPLALTIPETTRVLSTSRIAIYRYLKAGRLRATKVGTRTLIPMDSARVHRVLPVLRGAVADKRSSPHTSMLHGPGKWAQSPQPRPDQAVRT